MFLEMFLDAKSICSNWNTKKVFDRIKTLNKNSIRIKTHKKRSNYNRAFLVITLQTEVILKKSGDCPHTGQLEIFVYTYHLTYIHTDLKHLYTDHSTYCYHTCQFELSVYSHHLTIPLVDLNYLCTTVHRPSHLLSQWSTWTISVHQPSKQKN